LHADNLAYAYLFFPYVIPQLNISEHLGLCEQSPLFAGAGALEA